MDAQTVEQGNILHHGGEILMLNGIAFQHDDEGFAAVRINIGRRLAEPLNVSGGVGLHAVGSLWRWPFYSCLRRLAVNLSTRRRQAEALNQTAQ